MLCESTLVRTDPKIQVDHSDNVDQHWPGDYTESWYSGVVCSLCTGV